MVSRRGGRRPDRSVCVCRLRVLHALGNTIAVRRALLRAQPTVPGTPSEDVDGRSILVTVRGWDVLAGEDAGVGSGIGDAQVTAVTVGVRSGRPIAVVGRADATVHLLDLRSWTAAAPAFTLPRPASALYLLPGGDLLVGFGADVTLLRPPF
jgi:hypothetical protein